MLVLLRVAAMHPKVSDAGVKVTGAPLIQYLYLCKHLWFVDADIRIFISVRFYLQGQIMYVGHFQQPNIQKITIFRLRI